MIRFPSRLPRWCAPALLALGMAHPARALTGDVNEDLRLNAADAAAALAAAGGLWQPLNVGPGDVAGAPSNQPDGRIGLPDAVRVLRVLNGLDSFAPPVLSAPARDTVDLTADISKDYTLSRAYWVRGRVTDARGNAIGNGGGSLTTDTGIVFTPRAQPFARRLTLVSGQTGAYTAPVPAGWNDVAVQTEFTERLSGVAQAYIYAITLPAVPPAWEVTADTSADFTRPDPPAPGTVSGAVTAPGWGIPYFVFRLDGGGWAHTVPQGATEYTMRSGPGTGHFTVEFAYATGEGEDTTLSANIAGTPVTVTSGAETRADITLPALALLRGRLTTPGSDGRIGAVVNDAPGTMVHATTAAAPDTGAYTLAVPAGNATVILATTLNAAAGTRTQAAYVETVAIPPAGLRRDFTMPALPPLRRFAGTVNGPDGRPLPYAYVVLSPSGFPDALSPGWTGFAETTTSADGAFSVDLPPAKYDVEITPPTPDGPPPRAVPRLFRRGALTAPQPTRYHGDGGASPATLPGRPMAGQRPLEPSI